MNSIEYGFHRLYMRYASDEVFQTAAIERISIRDKEAREKLEKLAREIARVESEVHESSVPSVPDSSNQKIVKKRPGLSRSKVLQTKTSATEGRSVAMQSGVVTADRVLENVKKRTAQKERKNRKVVKPRKMKGKQKKFEIDVSEDEEDQGGMGRPESEGHRSENISKSATTAVKWKLAQNASQKRKIDSESDDNSIDSADEGHLGQKAFNKRRIDSESDEDSINSRILPNAGESSSSSSSSSLMLRITLKK
jgi:hypothetical protein